MKYYGNKTVNDFYMDCNIPISAKTDIYNGTRKIYENYQDSHKTEHDAKMVKAYYYNANTNLLKIYC